MDAVSLFAIVVFAAALYFFARAEFDEPLVRLFFAALMVLSAIVGGLGLLLRALG